MKASRTLRTASRALLLGAATLVPYAPAAGAQAAIKRTPSGFNLFTVEQDIEIGKQSAAEIEQQVRLVTSARTVQYLSTITSLLATHAPHYPFQVQAINSGDVNILVLPGGRIFLTRGLLRLTRSEAEVAGLIAHAMAHVVLRHGTGQVSRAYLSRAGLSALGGLAGRTGTTTRIVNTVGGFGLSAVFLRFNRIDEYDADALGAEVMSKAGYDPVAMATMLATLRRETARGAAIQRFNGSHPPVADRERRIRNLSNILRHGRSEIVGGFNQMRWVGGIETGIPAPPEITTSAGELELRATPVVPDIPAPSPQFTRFSDPGALVAIEHPANWDAYQSGMALSFVPAGGVVEAESGAPNLLQGLIVNQYEPFEDAVTRWNKSLTRHYAPFHDRTLPRGRLEDATDDLVRQILAASPHLTPTTRSAREEQIEGLRGYAVRLAGRSPVTGEMERVTLHTRLLPDEQVIYLACVAQGRIAASVERACRRMVQSMRINDTAMNRQ